MFFYCIINIKCHRNPSKLNEMFQKCVILNCNISRMIWMSQCTFYFIVNSLPFRFSIKRTLRILEGFVTRFPTL